MSTIQPTQNRLDRVRSKDHHHAHDHGKPEPKQAKLRICRRAENLLVLTHFLRLHALGLYSGDSIQVCSFSSSSSGGRIRTRQRRRGRRGRKRKRRRGNGPHKGLLGIGKQRGEPEFRVDLPLIRSQGALRAAGEAASRSQGFDFEKLDGVTEHFRWRREYIVEPLAAV